MTVTLDREALTQLARHVGWPAISIHMPTHRTGPDVLQDPIRFKNLMRKAEEPLSERLRAPQIEELLAPARALLDDPGFWRTSAEGLAVFISGDESRVVRTTSTLPEHVSVGDRFTIRSIIPALSEDASFFVLALSKNHVRLFSGDRARLTEIELKDMPLSMADALVYDDIERHTNFHTRTPVAASGRSKGNLSFHGHGGIPEVEKDRIIRFFREVDRGVAPLLRDKRAPLLLAGVDYLLPAYREINSYPHLTAKGLTGNPDERTESELHAAALELLEPVFAEALERDLVRLRESDGTSATSYDVSEIAEAAHQGRVSVLFVTPDAAEWGTWDPDLARVEPHDEQLPGDWDLADLTAVETLMHGGVVHTVESIADGRNDVAAIFRY